MSEAMDDKYLHLGRLIAAQCTPGFLEARLEGALDTDRPRFRLSWTAQDHSRHEAPEAAEMAEIQAALEDIREAMVRQNEGGRWRTFVVTLRKGGHFLLEVDD
ncbi:MAG: hypothetical protein JO276_09065 [Sphingomonadaceae bacterium]|nr:hypothetical protein [Sphingomonadaceae bacterium]